MAHTKAGGSTALGRDSVSKRLGVKKFGGEKVKTGEVIIRQRGTAFHPGKNVKRGNDDTLFALCDGVIKFSRRKMQKFTGNLKRTRFVSIVKK